MAGGFVPLRRCSSADEKEGTMAAQFGPFKDPAVGEEDSPLRKESCTERKATVAPDAGEVKRKAEQAEADCMTKGKEAADDAVVAEAAPAAVTKNLTRLPDEEVKWVLAWKREYLSPDFATAEEMKSHDYLSDIFTEYQDWVRQQYDANGGVVMLDDEQVEQRFKNEQLVQDMIDEINQISLADFYHSDELEDESDEEDDESNEEDGDEEEDEEEGLNAN